MRQSQRILQQNTENRWNVEVVFRPEIVRIFSVEFPPTSCTFQQELPGTHGEKSEKFPTGILLPQSDRNYRDPAVSEPGCST
jgi:hypothetical protein